MVAPEKLAMQTCTVDLIDGLASDNIGSLVDHLRQNQLMSVDVYEKIRLTMVIPRDKAREAVSHVSARVNADPEVTFRSFIKVLEDNGYSKLVKKLEDKFVEHGGDRTSLQQTTHSNDEGASRRKRSLKDRKAVKADVSKVKRPRGAASSIQTDKSEHEGAASRVQHDGQESADNNDSDDYEGDSPNSEDGDYEDNSPGSDDGESDNDNDDSSMAPTAHDEDFSIFSDHDFGDEALLSSKSYEYFGIDFSKIQEQKINGYGARIAIIDSSNPLEDELWIQETHAAFDKKPKYKVDFQRIAQSEISKNTRQKCSHALMCTSIAVGEKFVGERISKFAEKRKSVTYPGGIAPKAKATVFLVNLNDRRSVIKALKCVVEGDFHVLSMSLGMKAECPQMKKLIQKLEGKTIVVAAAGNKGNNIPVKYPAKSNFVISVGSLDIDFKPSSFTAQNIDVDIYYCGEIMTPISDSASNSMLDFSTGTSVAAPGVAGIICLLVQCAIKHDRDNPEFNLENDIRSKENIMKLLKMIIVQEKNKDIFKFDEEKLIELFTKRKTFLYGMYQ